ncbi:MAG TPA: glycoside hydrolase family 15 protein [Acidimicrobiales bacterium]|nr:glycoside hydrolase family 15 protein [Acidimicrobiales bacterium]
MTDTPSTGAVTDAGEATRRGDSFPPIADYAFLSDCESSCLVAPNGSVEWFCLPRPDSPSIFGALLDRAAGNFRFGPTGTQVPHHRRYIPGTMVLETTWHTPSGWLVVQDLLVVQPMEDGQRRTDYRRAPGDNAPSGVLLRIATCIEGHVEVIANLVPVFEYGKQTGMWSYEGEGYETMSVCPPAGDPSLTLRSSFGLGAAGARCYGRSTLAKGESAFVALSWSGRHPDDLAAAEAQLDATVTYWRDWLSNGTFPDHPWRIFLERSALTLKGLSYAPTGAIMAAATTSLPETPGGARNWDYRYTWIRDSSFMLRSLYRLGFEWEAMEYFAFVMEAVASDAGSNWDLQIMYGIDGRKDLTEVTLDYLSGWRNSRPVRVGNGAWNQQQNDVWGMLLDAVDIHLRQGASQIVHPVWEGVAHLVDTAIAHSGDPDQGIWEIRGDPQHFTASKVLCWVAMDRGAELAQFRQDTDRAEQWRKAADELQSEILDKGVDGQGRFRQHYANDELDASLLLIPILGFLPPDDDRVRTTVLAIADDLTEDGLVLRYKVDTTDTGFAGKEGTFTICSFWLVTALAMIGEQDRARALCQKLLNFAGPLQLYAEEIDATTGEHLGNFPQAFTHLALIDAVGRLIEAEEEAEAGAR